MSDGTGSEPTHRPGRDPDPAALDELSRAFGDPPRRTIRIDDYSGAVELDPVEAAALVKPVVRSAPVVPDDAGSPVEAVAAGSVRSVVIIDDGAVAEEIDDAPSGSSRRRRIDPRMRARRIAIRRAMGQRRLRIAVLSVVLGLVAVALLAVLGSSLFAVRAEQVTVTGVVYTDRERLDAVIDDLVGTPSLRVDTQRLEAELETIPWVEQARIRISFPRGAAIEIRERAAMATYQGPDGDFRVLDRSGRVLDVITNQPIAYVLVLGPDPVDLSPGDIAPVGYAAASELAKNLTPSIRGRVVHIEVTADGSRLSLLLDDGSGVYFGEARDFFAKLLRLESVLTANPGREPGPIDVSTPDVTL